MAYKEMHGEDRQLKDMMRTTSQKAPIEFEKLAEGASTVKALIMLGEAYHVDLPICKTVYSMLYQGKSASEALPLLFQRTVKGEFDY